MSRIIGFATSENNFQLEQKGALNKTVAPSLVLVFFPSIGRSYSYYNDKFDLKVGDIVFVEGKLFGERGEVEEVTRNFKIKLSDYKRVISVADTDVHGDFFEICNSIVSYDLKALNFEKVISWLMPADGEEFFTQKSENFFPITDLSKLGAKPEIIERGMDYFKNERVLFLQLSKTAVRAIVAGEEYYTVEFDRCGNELSSPTCSCFCFGACKHEVAAMLKLKELLESVDSDEFCAVSKAVFNRFVKAKEFSIK